MVISALTKQLMLTPKKSKRKMKMKSGFLVIALVAAIALAGISSCQKGQSITTNPAPAGKQSVVIHLNDDPIPNILKVLVDIRYIEVKVDTGTAYHDDSYYNDDRDGDDDHQSRDRYGKWDTLSVTPRVYDLLKLKNGVDTIIANGYANAGKIIKVRITLGNNNTIWTDATHSYPLTLCDNDPYLYVKVQTNTMEILPNGQTRIRVDFDVARSVEYDNGGYCLKPKLKSYSDNNSGKIEGYVKPRQANAMIKVYNSTDTAYAIPEEDGEFSIRGLKPAVYSVLYKATAPYRDTTINNIQVQAGLKTVLPVVTLR